MSSFVFGFGFVAGIVSLWHGFQYKSLGHVVAGVGLVAFNVVFLMVVFLT